MTDRDASPPLVRFAMRVIDAGDHAELAQVCADAMVSAFGAIGARVIGGDGVWCNAGAEPDDGGITLTLRLSAPDEAPVKLEVVLPLGIEIAIVRQQFLDIVAVPRRAWLRLAKLQHELSLARHDALTGLANRHALAEWLDSAYLAALHNDTSISVMMIDLDHFKRVNDTLGHPAGDDVLQHAADCFRKHLRPSDRVCRWGGDEFLVVVPHCDSATAAEVAHRLRLAFAADPRSRGATMTIGIADIEGLGPGVHGATTLVEHADACLLAAKQAGRNCTITTTRLRDVG